MPAGRARFVEVTDLGTMSAIPINLSKVVLVKKPKDPQHTARVRVPGRGSDLTISYTDYLKLMKRFPIEDPPSLVLAANGIDDWHIVTDHVSWVNYSGKGDKCEVHFYGGADKWAGNSESVRGALRFLTAK